jgi:hypothetical protein
MNWTEEIGKNLIKQVNVSVGDNHTIMYNLGDGKTVQFDYHKEKCVNIEHKDEKLEEDMKRLWDEFRIKK